MKAIIVAGGLGTRLRPLTDNIPKPLLPIQGKPTVQYAIEQLKKHGVKDMVLALSYFAEKIMDFFKDGKQLAVNMSYSIEKDPLGTGGAIKQAAEGFKDTFIVAWGDNLMDIDYGKMAAEHKANKALVTIALTKREDVEHFGVARLEGKKIMEFIEKPKREDAPTDLINMGAFVMQPEILDLLPEGKSSIERDCFEKISPEGKIFAYIHDGQWFPTDTKEKYGLAEKEWKA
ncbi:nucleotidyltransferase family protein [Candidatus Woesearchaeota archaeon]|nr:nucleotidyltransferase family protein [Candidatus Woesearchaeota archaeon]